MAQPKTRDLLLLLLLLLLFQFFEVGGLAIVYKEGLAKFGYRPE
jgi:hypothetical protein